MFIKNKYKRDPEALIKKISAIQNDYVVVTSPENISEELLLKVGFDHTVNDGDHIVPQECGKFTSFNLNGKNITRKDLPKVNRYITTICWHWTLWNGDEQEDYRDIYRDCYPREYITPPLEEVFFFKEKHCVVSRKIMKIEKEVLLHIVNVFLEIFGSCYITDDVLNIIPTQKLPWIIFPQGERGNYSNISAKDICSNYKKMSKRTLQFVEDRINFLKYYAPSRICIGESYFRNYFVFEYEDRGITVLESNSLDNATYIFDKDWEEYSKLTKGEVLAGNLHKKRFIHQKNWFTNMRKMFENPVEDAA